MRRLDVLRALRSLARRLAVIHVPLEDDGRDDEFRLLVAEGGGLVAMEVCNRGDDVAARQPEPFPLWHKQPVDEGPVGGAVPEEGMAALGADGEVEAAQADVSWRGCRGDRRACLTEEAGSCG